VFFVLFVFVLCSVYPMLQVSLDCPFLITPSIISTCRLKQKKNRCCQIYLIFTRWHQMIFRINRGQSSENTTVIKLIWRLSASGCNEP
jgi:hypothetical protein